MSNVKIFENADFGKIRTIIISNEPFFVGKDVATALGYSNASKAVIAHVDTEDRTKMMVGADSRNGNVVTETTFINESGVYSLVFASKLPKAKEFKRWVTSEVLPSIRKHGAYATPVTIENIIANPDFGIKLLQDLKDEQERNRKLKEANDDMKPKALFSDAITSSKTSILVGDLAKILRGNGIEIGSKRLFSWMRDNGFLIKGNRSDRNMPTQRAMEMGLFEIKESSFLDGNGTNHITKTPKVTGVGQKYFVNRFLAKKEAQA